MNVKEPGEVRKAALYIRVSTDAQAEEGYSIEAQCEKLKAQCLIKGLKNYELYIDGGWSGSNLQRPEMQRMIKDILAGRIATVMVYKLDRISRSQKDTLYLIEDVLIPNGVEFISLNENLDTSTSYGRAMIGILSAFAQLERENIHERTGMGMLERVKEGYWRGGGKIPYGYDYDRKAGILVPNEDAETVRRIYRLYIEGASAQKIADLTGLRYDRLVTQILRRKSNTGVQIYRGKEYPARHEAIISLETYEHAMELMRTRSRKTSYGESPYLLTGLVECGVCGAKMRYFKHKDEKESEGFRLTLACNSRYKSKPYLVKDESCTNPIIDARELERYIVSDLFRLSVKADEKKGEPGAAGQALDETLRQRKAELERRLRNLYVRFGDSRDEQLLAVLEQTHAELEDINGRIEEEKGKHTIKNKENEKILPTIRDNWARMSMAEKRELIRILIDKIVVYEDRAVIHYSL